MQDEHSRYARLCVDLRGRAPARRIPLPYVTKGYASLVKVEPAPNGTSDEPLTPSRKFKYKDGVRNKGIRGEDLILSLLPANITTIEAAFAEHGFAHNSHFSALSKLKKEKKLELNTTTHLYSKTK